MQSLEIALVQCFGKVILRFFAGVQWEGDCEFIYETLSSFHSWCTSEGGGDCGEFSHVDKTTHWVYCDYTYLQQITADVKQIVDWSQFGFGGADEGADCAMWMGTTGAHTVCHQDTYGFNVVLQVNKSCFGWLDLLLIWAILLPVMEP